VFATAADQLYAEKIAGYPGLFSHVIASDGIRNFRGQVKVECIRAILRSEVSYSLETTAPTCCFRAGHGEYPCEIDSISKTQA
jgi:hypothetical protein